MNTIVKIICNKGEEFNAKQFASFLSNHEFEVIDERNTMDKIHHIIELTSEMSEEDACEIFDAELGGDVHNHYSLTWDGVDSKVVLG